MPMRISGLMVLLVSVQLAAGCSDTRNPVGPSGVGPPSAQGPAPPPSQAGNQIRGAVTDTAWRAVPGARVEVIDGPSAGNVTTTDAQGQFSMTGTFDEATQFRATQDGHVPAVATLARSCPTCPRWLHFTLDVVAVPIHVEGAYLLTIMADPACTTLPERVRTRVYEVRVQASVQRPTTAFDVDIAGALTLNGYRASLNVAGDYVLLALGDWHGTPEIVEQLAGTTYVSFDGGANGAIGAERLGTLDAPFEGVIDYCELPEPMGVQYACSPPQGFTHVACTSSNHRVILTRR